MTELRLIVILAAAVCLMAVACTRNQVPTITTSNINSNRSSSSPDQFAAARTTFGKECKNCHGANGEGGPVKLDDGTKLKVPTLREGHSLRHEDAEFSKQIIKGGDGMPAFEKKLTPEQINDLIKFIRHEFQGK